jgi:hypothetical protein
MWTMVAGCLLIALPPTVELRTASGETASGTLVELDSQHVLLEGTGGRVSWPIDKLSGVAPKSSPATPPVPLPVLVELVDTSTLAAVAFSTQKEKAQLTLPGGQRMELAGRDVKSVRFMQAADAIVDKWARIVKQETAADILVAKKGESIDYHKGVVGKVTDETVEFELDGEKVPVKRAKVFGLVYRRPAGRELPEPVGFVAETSGSNWAVRSIAWAGGQFEWTTPLGVKVARPASAVARLDFSRGKVVYLSDLAPEATDWVPYFGAGKELPTQVALFAPRMDRSLEAGPLQLDKTRYAKGLALHSRTTLVYRLPDRYARFSAVVGIDDAVRPQGNVRLVIRGDDRPLLEAVVTGSDPPRHVDFDVSGVRRLTILVDFGDDFDVGDHLDLCEARLVK